MDPVVVDMLSCLDGGQCSDKTLLAGAVGGEAGSWPVTGRIRSGGGVPFGSDVIQSVRCSLMAKRLFGDVGVWALVKACTYWRKSKSDNMYCNAV